MLLDGLGDAQVHRAALVQPDRVVDDVARDAVLEAQRLRLLAGEDEVEVGQCAHQRVVAATAGEHLQQPGRHHVADHRRRAQQLDLGRRQARQARLDQDVQPRRAAVRATGQAPAVLLCHGQRVAQLLDEQRIAARVTLQGLGFERVDARQQVLHGLRDLGLGERLQRQQLGPELAEVGRAQLARGDQHQDPGLLDRPHRGQHLARRLVRPLPVVQRQHQRLLRGQRHQQVAQGTHQRLGHQPPRRRAEHRGRVWQRQRPQQRGPVGGKAGVDLGQALLDLGRRLVRRLAMHQLEQAAQRLQKGLKGLGAERALAVAAHHPAGRL